jgi:amino acid transporter
MPSAPPPQLLRALGRWDLTAIGVNQVIGGGVFLLPAAIALNLGSWSWVGVAATGVLAMMIALNFAEAGSRFESTGGAYLYTRQAFGRFAGFEVGWMMWATRAASWASVVNGLADALGFYFPSARAGAGRSALIAAVILTIMAVNIRGIRQSSMVVNVLTIGKLTPLVLFILLGLPHVAPATLVPASPVTWNQLTTAALALIFAFGGYEVITVPAGESRDPRRIMPFAMVATILIVTVVMTLAQVVAVGTLPGLAASRTPLADAALVFLGGWGAFLMTTGAAVSMSGNNMGQALSGSRNLFALAEQGDLPAVFGHVHPRFRTPDFAIVFTSLVALVLALSGSFITLAAASAVARLMVYAGTCASVLALRREGPAPFTIPFGPLVPVAALAISVAILYGATAAQLRIGGAFLVAGALLFAVAARRGRV